MFSNQFLAYSELSTGEYKAFKILFMNTTFLFLFSWFLYFTSVPQGLKSGSFFVATIVCIITISLVGWLKESIIEFSIEMLLYIIAIHFTAILLIGTIILKVFPKLDTLVTFLVVNLSTTLLFLYLIFRILVILFPNDLISTSSSFKSNIPNFKNYHIAKNHALIFKRLSKANPQEPWTYCLGLDRVFGELRFDTETQNFIFKQLMLNKEIQQMIHEYIVSVDSERGFTRVGNSFINDNFEKLNDKIHSEIAKFGREQLNEPLVITEN